MIDRFIRVRFQKWTTGGQVWVYIERLRGPLLLRPINCFLNDKKWNGFEF